jgi:hypothetical protein
MVTCQVSLHESAVVKERAGHWSATSEASRLDEGLSPTLGPLTVQVDALEAVCSWPGQKRRASPGRGSIWRPAPPEQAQGTGIRRVTIHE